MNFPHIYPPTSPTCKTRFAGADAGSSTQDKNLIWLHHRLLPRSITYSWPMVKILMLCNYLHSAHTQKGLAARRLAGSAPRNFLEWPQGFQNARLRLSPKRHSHLCHSQLPLWLIEGSEWGDSVFEMEVKPTKEMRPEQGGLADTVCLKSFNPLVCLLSHCPWQADRKFSVCGDWVLTFSEWL